MKSIELILAMNALSGTSVHGSPRALSQDTSDMNGISNNTAQCARHQDTSNTPVAEGQSCQIFANGKL